MKPTIDVLLLFALPASGKSELLRYLNEVPADRCRDEFHLGPLVTFHDYPFVRMMRRFSEELRSLGRDGVFFAANDTPIEDPRDWGTLIELLNDEFDDQLHGRILDPPSAAHGFLERLDAARGRVGLPAVYAALSEDEKDTVVAALEADAMEILELKNARAMMPVDGTTLVIELARGGPEGATAPLPHPLGYQHALARFSDDILSRASVLYVWVTPEQSRQLATARPDGERSILHHGVPEAVMRASYGMDDMEHLLRTSDRPDTVRVATRGRVHHLPAVRFDNREHRTAFLSRERAAWPARELAQLHTALAGTFTRLLDAGARRHDGGEAERRAA